MLLYIIGFIVLIITLFFCYIRIKFKFWALQPVFHFYDLYYWFVNVGIINNELPNKNRYTNFKSITTKVFEKVNEIELKNIITLIKLNYFVNKENKYYPKLENILPYFRGHNDSTYWSYFVEPELLIDTKTDKTIEEKKIIGIITSRPLHVKIISLKKVETLDVYYVDYLCVNKSWRKKNIAPQLIQTHEYNQSHNNKKISVSLFKREEELTGIIPLTIYKTYCFSMKNMTRHKFLNAKFVLLTGDKQNIYYVYEFINKMVVLNKWSIMICPEISNVIELVATNNLFVKLLVIDGTIEAAYIFRKTCTFINKNKEIISCIASVKGNELTKEEFIYGFKVALGSIITENTFFYYLMVEDISDNIYILTDILLETPPMVISPMAYFFYNFAYSPFKSNKCLIIN